MELNADFSSRVAVHAARLEWKSSPMPGVDRRMLDRIGDEVARATSIVRYAPESSFSPHTHTGGEEFLVLEGVFQDEHGDFPAGTYVRNPPESSHTPGSAPGCVIFVKLWQFDMADRKQVRIDTNNTVLTDDPNRSGVKVMPLYDDAHEEVSMELWTANTDVVISAPEGMEILVIEGGFAESGEEFEMHSWLRLPKGYRSTLKAGGEGARVWVKRGHLASDPTAPAIS